MGGSPASNANDGNTGTFWIQDIPVSYPSYWQVDLENESFIDKVRLAYTIDAQFNLNISVSTDNVTFTQVYANSSFYVGQDGTFLPNITFTQVSARYVKVNLVAELKLPNGIATLREVEVYGNPPPILISPANGSTQSKAYPPLTTSINFSWTDGSQLSSNLIVAKDANFNIVTVDTTVSTNYSSQSLEFGDYWWKVRYYDSTTGLYSNYSSTFNFTISGASGATGTGIEGIVYELIGGVQTPISGVTVYLYNNTLSQSMITGSNGYYLFTGLENSTTYNIYATKQGYDTTPAFPITTGVGTVVTNDILMKIYISPYVPNFVFEKFVVRGLFDNPYPGVTVNVYKGDDVVASFTGVTDSAGQVVFQLIKDQKYRVTFSGGGLSSTLTYTIYGKEETYLVTIVTGFPSGGDRHGDINATLTYSTFNATYNNLSLIYTDSRSSTTDINFYATNLSTNVTCTQSSAAQTAYLNCTVLASGTYQFGYNATSSIYGFFQADKVINFDSGKPSTPSVALPGVSSNILHWLSIILIVFVASLFSIKTVKYGAVLVPLLAVVFWAFGWLQVNFLLVSTAMVIGVLVYMRMSEVKVNY